MADFNIQRGVKDFGASADTATESVTTGGTDKAFVRITNVMYSSAGLTAGSTGNFNCDDLGCRAELTDSSTITFTRLSTGDNSDFRVFWEIWEYTGSVGGGNEFIVRDTVEVTTTDGTAVNQNIAGISSRGNCIPFITGVTCSDTSQNWDDANCTATMIDNAGSDAVQVQRAGASNTTITGIAVVEFTGANWAIENNVTHSFAAAGADEDETITDVSDWATAFIIGGMRVFSGEIGLEDNGYNIRPDTTTTAVTFRAHTGADNVTNYRAVAHVAKNAGLTVQHLDSITSGGTDLPAGSASPQSENRTVTAVSDTAQTAVIGFADCAGGGSAYPRMHWGYRLTTTTNVEFWRARHGQVGDWSLQVIQFPEGTQRRVFITTTG